MKFDDLLNLSPDKLVTMSDAEILEVLAPYFTGCRPSDKPVQKSSSSVVTSASVSAAQKTAKKNAKMSISKAEELLARLDQLDL